MTQVKTRKKRVMFSYSVGTSIYNKQQHYSMIGKDCTKKATWDYLNNQSFVFSGLTNWSVAKCRKLYLLLQLQKDLFSDWVYDIRSEDGWIGKSSLEVYQRLTEPLHFERR